MCYQRVQVKQNAADGTQFKQEVTVAMRTDSCDERVPPGLPPGHTHTHTHKDKHTYSRLMSLNGDTHSHTYGKNADTLTHTHTLASAPLLCIKSHISLAV